MGFSCGGRAGTGGCLVPVQPGYDVNYLSVCAGIEAATVAWHPFGWNPVGFSEIEKFPSKVLQHHYPDVPNYGDMNDFQKWPTTDIDVLVGGTPCQSFSVAGLREGMADPRGNLALVYLAIAKQYRTRWLVWENVPGVLSSDGGRDFAAIIGGMVKLGYGIAYRVLDAQYFGVPQRRRRVFVVGCLGDWRSAAKVLFEPASLRRHPPPRREPRQDVTHSIRSRTPGSGGAHEVGFDNNLIPDVANTIPAHSGVVAPDFTNYLPDVVGALSDGAHCGGGLNGQDAYSGRIIPVVGALTAKGPGGMGAPEVDANHYIPEITHTLRARHDSGDDGTGRGTPIIAFAQNQRDEVRLMDKAGALSAEPGAKQQTYVFKPGQGSDARSDAIDEHIAPTVSSGSGGNQVPAVAFSCKDSGADAVEDVTPTMRSMNNPNSNISGGGHLAIQQHMSVRRLTPLECERLQGFPDGYTNIPGASDSARYKALGNSMAVPVMNWIGRRINEVC